MKFGAHMGFYGGGQTGEFMVKEVIIVQYCTVTLPFLLSFPLLGISIQWVRGNYSIEAQTQTMSSQSSLHRGLLVKLEESEFFVTGKEGSNP